MPNCSATPKSCSRSARIASCNSSFDGERHAHLIGLDRRLHFLQLVVLDELHDVAGGFDRDALLDRRSPGGPCRWRRARDRRALKFFTGTLAPHQPRLHDFPQRVHLDLVVGDERQLLFRGVEVDLRLRALEVVALADFLARLVEGVVDFLEIDRSR